MRERDASHLLSLTRVVVAVTLVVAAVILRRWPHSCSRCSAGPVLFSFGCELADLVTLGLSLTRLLDWAWLVSGGVQANDTNVRLSTRAVAARVVGTQPRTGPSAPHTCARACTAAADTRVGGRQGRYPCTQGSVHLCACMQAYAQCCSDAVMQ